MLRLSWESGQSIELRLHYVYMATLKTSSISKVSNRPLLFGSNEFISPAGQYFVKSQLVSFPLAEILIICSICNIRLFIYSVLNSHSDAKSAN